jgi:peptide/nickel transport system permease protein
MVFFRNPLTIKALIIIIFFVLMASFQPLFVARILDSKLYDPILGFDMAMDHPSRASFRHPLGTDHAGRDVLSQLAYSTRTSIVIGLISAVVGALIATIVGVAAAYFEGLLDRILMAFTDVFIMLPPAIVLIVVGLTFDLTSLQVALIYGIFAGLGSFALMVKVQTLTIKNRIYTEAARVAGGRDWRIIGVHILPNLTALITLNMLFIVTGSVMVEAILSFYLPSSRFSWGGMIWGTFDAFARMQGGYQWHVMMPPVIAIILFCGSFYLLARSLDEVVNPKLRER